MHLQKSLLEAPSTWQHAHPVRYCACERHGQNCNLPDLTVTRGLSSRIFRPTGSPSMRVLSCSSAHVPVVSPTAATKSARCGLERKGLYTCRHARSDASHYLSKAPTDASTAIPACCKGLTGTWVGYKAMPQGALVQHHGDVHHCPEQIMLQIEPAGTSSRTAPTNTPRTA